MTKLLLVEDDEAILSAMQRGFAFEGYVVVAATDGQEALRLAAREVPDLVILDLMLPKLDGFRVCKDLRSSGNRVPIIMLTARDNEIDKVSGLRLGADDYVTKPFSFLELLARVEAVLRRAVAGEGGSGRRGSERIRLDPKRLEIWKDGRLVDASKLEYRLLEYLMNHRDEIVTRDRILDDVWGINAFPFTRTVDTHVAKLRKKLEENPADPKLIVTVHGLGYKYAG